MCVCVYVRVCNNKIYYMLTLCHISFEVTNRSPVRAIHLLSFRQRSEPYAPNIYF